MSESDPRVMGVLETLDRPLTRRALLRGGAVGLGAVSLAACGSSSPQKTSNQKAGTPRKGGTLTMARPGDIQTMDPILITDNMTLWGVFDTIYRGLVRVDDAGTGFQPELAESWSLSHDGRTYTFHLRPGLRFSDGSPLKASDAVFSLNRIAKDPKSIARSLYPAGMKVSAPNDRTVVVQFPQSAPSMLAVFGIDPIHSEAWFKRNGAAKLANAPAGTCTGPWMFSEWSKGSQFVIKANPYYWNKPGPYLDRVVFNVVSDANSQVLQLESGSVDIASTPPVNQITAINSHSGLTVQTAPLFGAYVILPNFKRPEFRDLKVRQAMNYAIDKEAMIKTVMFGYAEPQISAVPGPMKNLDATNSPWPHDLAKAKQLMAQSAYPHGFSTKLLIASGDPVHEGIATIAKSAFAQIGIEASIQALDLSTQQGLLYKYDYDLYVEEYTSDQIDPAFILEFTSVGKQFVNSSWTNYYNPAVNKLWNRSQVEANPSKRAQELIGVQRLAWNDAQFIYLFDPKSITALRDNVHGFSVNPTAHYFLETVWKS
jgi:peptide/nickel transport system substrate-binding protein